MSARRIVVVGAGTSGGVIAARLSEHEELDVVLIEAGPDYVEGERLPAELRDPFNPDLTSHDWGAQAFFVEPATSRPASPYPRGRGVGGSSLINGAVAVRGQPRDYDGWAAAGNDGWDWQAVLPSFRRLEDDPAFDGALHGRGGPIPIVRYPVMETSPTFRAFLEACEERGFDMIEDHNDPSASGAGPLPRNEIDGVRASPLVTYLRTARERSNLTILSDRRALRVALRDGRVTGVETTVGGQTESIYADEVVLAAGAIMSPHLLIHSGIGPRSELERVGVKCVIDLPGVGRSLRDHAITGMVGLLPDDADEATHGFQVMLRCGPAGTESDLFILGAIVKTSSLNFPTPVGADMAFSLANVLGRPESAGWLAPRSADPLDLPELHMNFLSTARDRQRMTWVTRLGYELLQSSTFRPRLSSIALPEAQAMASDESLDAWLTDNVTTGFHAAGTCRMGPASDAGAVVDARLRVRGVDGLYVADASIMPDITAGLTHLTCFMIGERFAELFLDARGTR